MKRKKVALIFRGCHGGGIEKVFESYLSNMDMSLYDIHIVTNMKNIPESVNVFKKMGCVLHELSNMSGHRITIKNIFEYDNLFKNEKFDIVHNNVPDNLLPLFFAKKYNVPIRILHSHNIYTDNFHKKRKIIAEIYRKGFKFNTSNASILVAVSKKAAEAAFANRAKEAIILKNAIDLDKFTFNIASRNNVRNLLGITDSDILFGHIGRYENDQKNQEFVLELFSKIHKFYSNTKLVMIGEGKKRQEFMKLAEKLYISDSVIFTGQVPNTNEYLSAMDVYLFPSRKEGLPLAGVEAQASGVKCYFSDRIPEEAFILDSLEILSVDGEDAISNWLKAINSFINNSKYKNLRERKKAIDEISNAGFDIRTQVYALEELYKKNINT